MLDAVNLGGGGNGNRQSPKRRESVAGARSVSTRPIKDNSPEAKAAKAFFQAMNVLAFDPARFALIFSRAELAVQKRALETLIALIDLLAFRWDEAHYSTEEEREFLIAAKRAADAMAPFRERGML